MKESWGGPVRYEINLVSRSTVVDGSEKEVSVNRCRRGDPWKDLNTIDSQ